MPRDCLVYASGTVRSTASNNAPYKDGVRQREKRRGERERHRAHIRSDTQATRKAHMHRNSDETQRDTEPKGNTYTTSHFPVAGYIQTL